VNQSRANRFAVAPLVKRYRVPAAAFARKYTAGDVALLVEIDKASGPGMCSLTKASLAARLYFTRRWRAVDRTHLF